jgi:hypothetical protein
MELIMKTKRKNKNVVISLFDHSGIMVEPWLEAGAECWIVDIRHPPSHSGKESVIMDERGDERGIHRVHHDLSTPWLYPGDKSDVAMVFAFPPCDHLAVSGARWFKGKGLRVLSKSIELFATAADFCEWSGAPYLIENPVSTISTYWRRPDYTFHPFQYTGYHGGDNYTKKTCLWTGNNFSMPRPLMLWGLGEPDHRIHAEPPSPERSERRGVTPKGFAHAVFEENKYLLGDESGRVIHPMFLRKCKE